MYSPAFTNGFLKTICFQWAFSMSCRGRHPNLNADDILNPHWVYKGCKKKITYCSLSGKSVWEREECVSSRCMCVFSETPATCRFSALLQAVSHRSVKNLQIFILTLLTVHQHTGAPGPSLGLQMKNTCTCERSRQSWNIEHILRAASGTCLWNKRGEKAVSYSDTLII